MANNYDLNPGEQKGRALIVMEQGPLCNLVTFALNHGRYERRKTHTVAEAAAIADDWRPHLAVVDIDLGTDDRALELIGRVLPDGSALHVIGLTRRGDMKAKLAAFARGVDDILTVPFAPEELVARAVALMKRVHAIEISFDPVIEVGELSIDLLNRSLRAQSHELHLTSLEQALLYLLAANQGEILTREMILDSVWGFDFVAESNVVDRHIRNLRIKLQNDWRRPRYVETVTGAGYRFLPRSDASAGAGPYRPSPI